LHLDPPPEPSELDRWRRDPATGLKEPCPGWHNLREWTRALAVINQFFDGPLAARAAAAGWELLDLLAVHNVVGVARRDCCGALISGAHAGGCVVAVESDGTLRFNSGLANRKRKLDPNLCVLVIDFNKQSVAK
jgi:hypothetical protein